MKLWGGRFSESTSEISEEISESISFDIRLYVYDIFASKAHATMLAEAGIISQKSMQNIHKGLEKIQNEIEKGDFSISYKLEDIHMHIEARLIELIGEDGKKLHTGRSRNDQVAVDTHLFVLSRLKSAKSLLVELLNRFYKLAKLNQGKPWAGYTHLQIAQPVDLAHYLLAWFWKFSRDFDLLTFAQSEASVSPLGSAAMAGPNYAIKREVTRKLLGFSANSDNSMDAVSTRDYQLSAHYFITRVLLHISRFCEDLIIYNSAEFSTIRLGDKVTTGSSIMPQKKNPDIAELLRGKSARVIGNYVALMINLKGLPLTYNRDLQEDKVYLFDSFDQLRLALLGMIEILDHIEFDSEKISYHLESGYAQATDIADHLVLSKKMSFRDAHELVGKLVAQCEREKITLSQLPELSLEKVGLKIEDLHIKACIARKTVFGGTGEVVAQLERAQKRLKLIMKD